MGAEIRINNRYILRELIGSGGMGAVYRATDRLSGKDVALKQVTVPPQLLRFSSRAGANNINLALAQEFKTLASIRHPNIVSVHDYGFDSEGRPFFTMDLLENARTIVETASGQSENVIVDLLIQLLQVLAYLHRRGVLHRDLKPGNIMVVSGQVKVLDFGLSLVTEKSVADISLTTSGTFAYMAPELIQGDPPSRRSDLYAVGIVAYELLAKKHPFNTENLALLISQTLSAPIDMSPIGENEALAKVIARLVDRNPNNRYQNANNTIQALCEAAGVESPPQTSEIRESYLQASRFVGRETEMKTLTDALDLAIKNHGSAWLIGGESGVGKTRLCEELRSVALIRGALVVRGQSVTENSSPYQAWRIALRRLVIEVELEDDVAGPLKTIIPDIEVLLDRPIIDPPPLQPKDAQERLLLAVERLYQLQSLPVLTILEDLQWADSNSQSLLNRLITGLVDAPAMFLGNFRSDEKPSLPQEMDGIKELDLGRLGQNEIARLSASILGTAGRAPQILDLLQRETEGNPFFLVETVRALAEEAGQLDKVGAMELPVAVFSTGVRNIVQRRLARLPAHAQPLLEFAAVFGRDLDLEIMAELDTSKNLDDWLLICTDAAILDFQGNNWRFTHDKLREIFLDGIPDAKLPKLHHRVAAAIEVVFQDDPTRFAALAHHWRIAGDKPKALNYAVKAGQFAFQNEGLVEAIAHMQIALELLPDVLVGEESKKMEVVIRQTLVASLTNTEGYGSKGIIKNIERLIELIDYIQDNINLTLMLNSAWSYYLVHADWDKALWYTDRMLQLAEEASEPYHFYTYGHNAAACNSAIRGNFKDGARHARAALEYFDPRLEKPLASLYGHTVQNASGGWLAVLLLHLGYPDQASVLEKEIRELTVEPYGQAFSLYIKLFIDHYLQDDGALLPDSSKLLEIGSKNDFGEVQFIGGFFQASAYSKIGKNVDESFQVMEQFLKIAPAGGFAIYQPFFTGVLAERYMQYGNFKKAKNWLKKGLEARWKYQDRCYEPEIYRLIGDCELELTNNVEAAEDNYQKAIVMARETDAKWWEMRATTSLSQLLTSLGRNEDAFRGLAEVYDWFSEGFDTQDLKKAKVLLNSLEVVLDLS